MKWINQFYKTRTLYQNGIFILVCLALVYIASLLMPNFEIEEQDKQLFSIDGGFIKYGDKNQVSHYFNSIRNNDGVLVLGTSESGRYPNGNYFDFLNNDPDLKDTRFSVIGGAGRTCGLHIPTFWKHKEDLKGLKIIYFINPVYWRTGLARLAWKYWERDHNPGNLLSIDMTDEEKEKYYGPVQGYLDFMKMYEKVDGAGELMIRDVHRKFFQEWDYIENPEHYYDELVYLAPNEGDLQQFPLFGQIDVEAIDTTWGVSYEYSPKGTYDPIDTTINYRYEELASFMRLCKDLELDITYLIGPYNERFIEKRDTAIYYQQVVDNLKAQLERSGANYIDASGISGEPGVFKDLQHHSSYGAYRIYQILKKEYCGK